MEETKFKRKFIGKVVKLSGEKTIKVRVETKYAHPKYGRIIKSHKSYLVHNPENTEVKVNDEVEIQESRPISKMKKWELVRIVKESNNM